MDDPPGARREIRRVYDSPPALGCWGRCQGLRGSLRQQAGQRDAPQTVRGPAEESSPVNAELERSFVKVSAHGLVTRNRFVQIQDDPANLRPGGQFSRFFVFRRRDQADMQQLRRVFGLSLISPALNGEEFEQ